MSPAFKNSSELQHYLQDHPCLAPVGVSLGNLLLEHHLITPTQLETALNYQHAHPDLGRLGQVLL